MVVTIKEKGTDDTDTAVWNKVDKINNSSVDFSYVNVSPAFNLQMKDEISLLDVQNTKIFGGFIRSINNNLLKETIAFGYDVLLSDIEIQKNFENYSPEGIIQYCVEYAGLVYNSTITSGITVKLYPAKDKKLKYIIDDMLNVLGAVSRVDNDKNYYLEYAGETLNSTTLTIGSNCSLESGWDLDTDNLCTQVKVKGDIETIQTEEPFSGDNSETEFSLANIFVSIKVEHPVGTELKPEISGIQTGDYSISRETQKIIFNSAPATGTDNILITYTYDREITYTESSEIILPDKSNLHRHTVKKDYLKDIEDVEAYASDYLNKFSKPLVSGVVSYNNLNINDFKINNSIKVIDNTRKIDGNFVNKTLIIKRVVREFGEAGASLMIHVGENTEFSFNRGIEQETRLKQLEEHITTAELLQFGIKTYNAVELQFDLDVTDLELRTFDSDTFYLEENSAGIRNQMKEDGTGPVMRETGYTVGGSQPITTNTAVITTTYQDIAKDNFVNLLLTNITHLAVGDDNTTPVVTNITMNNETYRKASTITRTGLIITQKAVLDITENNGNTVYEMAGFDAASSGNMYYHNLTTVVAKDGNTEIRLSNVTTVTSLNKDL